MLNEDQMRSREAIKTNMFAPASNAMSSEAQRNHALNYVAYYLGEIESHLGKIAAELETANANGAKISLDLHGIAHMIPNLLKDR
jgi:hypothetical protein